ncbi:MAG: response regulator transcription factor [Anaerolineae bacterium]|nr:response regulator transcription factor [Anaerolineae bacterium]
MYKLLLVDDDSTLLRFMSEFLSGDGFEIISAPNGQEALRTAYRERPDLVVLDVMMPGMDGWEVTARLRELSSVPIIMLTAKNSENDKLRGFKLGVDDYVTKPFSFAELSARITAVLNRSTSSGGGENNQVLFGDFVLDMDRRELLRKDQVIALTPTEYRLLEVLARRPGRTISEFELIKDVWGAYKEEETAAVRRYIFLLRQKIEEDPAKPQWVVTVRGFGYRLELQGVSQAGDRKE